MDFEKLDQFLPLSWEHQKLQNNGWMRQKNKSLHLIWLILGLICHHAPLKLLYSVHTDQCFCSLQDIRHLRICFKNVWLNISSPPGQCLIILTTISSKVYNNVLMETKIPLLKIPVQTISPKYHWNQYEHKTDISIKALRMNIYCFLYMWY